MAKLVAKIEIYEDDKASGSFTSPPDNFINGLANPYEPWTITLASREIEKIGHSKVDVMAHELGHFVSLFNGTPVAAKDIANTRQTDIIPRYQFLADRYAEETEAWDIGRVIKPDIPDETVKFSLNTYKVMVDRAKFQSEIMALLRGRK